jgi:hypothetical protein
VLVGQDAAELASLETDRRRRGLPMEIWRGTVEDLRRLMERLRSAGTAWFIAVPAGPPDRTELIARTLDDARSAA